MAKYKIWRRKGISLSHLSVSILCPNRPQTTWHKRKSNNPVRMIFWLSFIRDLETVQHQFINQTGPALLCQHRKSIQESQPCFWPLGLLQKSEEYKGSATKLRNTGPLQGLIPQGLCNLHSVDSRGRTALAKHTCPFEVMLFSSCWHFWGLRGLGTELSFTWMTSFNPYDSCMREMLCNSPIQKGIKTFTVSQLAKV